MPEAAAITEKLDQHLQEVVQALHGAVKRGITDPKVADKAIHDCQEILGVIMEGKVDDWIE